MRQRVVAVVAAVAAEELRMVAESVLAGLELAGLGLVELELELEWLLE